MEVIRVNVETTETVATAEAQMARAAIIVNGVPIIIHTGRRHLRRCEGVFRSRLLPNPSVQAMASNSNLRLRVPDLGLASA